MGNQINSKQLANQIRKHAVIMTNRAASSHIAGALSAADIIAVLYADIMRFDASNPEDENRDRFILSKGHSGTAVYAALAETGFFEAKELEYYYKNGSHLSGHLSHKGVAGVEFSTGSLGHGGSVGAGMALAFRMDGKDNRVFVVLGDGECNEGSVWEMALFASQYHLENLTVIVDNNGMQGLGKCEDVLNMQPMTEKWSDFGFHVIGVDGHDHTQLAAAFAEKTTECKPKCIIAKTVKGKGVSYMENELLWHYRPPTGDEFDRAMKELEGEQ